MKQKLQSMMYRWNGKMQQFMIGRNGTDDFGKFLFRIVFVCFIGLLFIKSSLLYWCALLLIGYSYFRMFSKNIPKRYEENQKYLTLRYKATAKWGLFKKHAAESKTYRFYKCPQCKQKVRVPKGRGKICITCPKCRMEFIKKS